jgi:hypothetical protein
MPPWLTSFPDLYFSGFEIIHQALATDTPATTAGWYISNTLVPRTPSRIPKRASPITMCSNDPPPFKRLHSPSRPQNKTIPVAVPLSHDAKIERHFQSS